MSQCTKRITLLLAIALITTGSCKSLEISSRGRQQVTTSDQNNSVEPVKIDPILRRALLRALSTLEKTDSDADSADETTDDSPTYQSTVRSFSDTYSNEDSAEDFGGSTHNQPSFFTTEPTYLTTDFQADNPGSSTTEVQFHSFVVDAGRSDDVQTITASSVIPLKPNAGSGFTRSKPEDHSQVAQRNLLSAIRANQVIDADEAKTTTLKQRKSSPTTTIPTTTTPTTTTTKRPEHNADGENIEQVEKDGVQVYQAPLVAAFTVHQDAQGHPRSVVPIYKQQQNALHQQHNSLLQQQNALLQQQSQQNGLLQQQGLLTSQTQSLSEKQRRLEQQLYDIQQRHRQQELYLLKQQRYFQERQLEQQRFLLQQREEEERRRLLFNQQFQQQQQQQQQQQFGNGQLQQQQQQQQRFRDNFAGRQSQQSVTFTPSISLSPVVPREQQLPVREPVDFLRNQQYHKNGLNQQNPSNSLNQQNQANFINQQHSLNLLNQQNSSNQQHFDNQIYSQRNFGDLRQTQRSVDNVDHFNNVLSGQQLPPQREFREFRSQVQIVPSVQPDLNQNANQNFNLVNQNRDSHLQSNRVFRSELSTSSFGFNDNISGRQNLVQNFNQGLVPVQSNRVFRSEFGTGNFGLNEPAFSNRLSQQDRYRDLLYRSGFTQRPEDLNIVSKVLALNPGGNDRGNFLFGETKLTPTIVKPPPTQQVLTKT